MHLEGYTESAAAPFEEYLHYLKEAMPYVRFIGSFKVRAKDRIDRKEVYDWYLRTTKKHTSFMRNNFDEFKHDCFFVSEIDEAEYETLKKQLSEEILDWDAFMKDYIPGVTGICDYDPVNHQYLEGTFHKVRGKRPFGSKIQEESKE